VPAPLLSRVYCSSIDLPASRLSASTLSSSWTCKDRVTNSYGISHCAADTLTRRSAGRKQDCGRKLRHASKPGRSGEREIFGIDLADFANRRQGQISILHATHRSRFRIREWRKNRAEIWGKSWIMKRSCSANESDMLSFPAIAARVVFVVRPNFLAGYERAPFGFRLPE
jgi:hypothetical protein